tara:strand:- start:3963 stop:4454 length:492 start_codon:yes stop_codon:yes gene_type:complete
MYEDEIESIEVIGFGPSIDIEVNSDDHLFWANGILTHNSSINEQEHDQSMIAGGISKIHTADNVITIYATQAMKERGQYQIQFIKTRSSSGVGSKLFLGYDPATLKIFDLEDQGQVQQAQAAVVTDVLADLRRKNTQPKSDTQPPVATNKMQDLSKLTSLIRR